ncbi:alpha-amylase family glycosyl hydrolase [Dyadobacter pollutisoli]|uniref:Alpha-amylase family glycosyl hydrolase n=1 Tax=Dyadobacter pollutisoli TaxID=2910158 RepID=A0A9E8SLG4_9BACT|nr:alpha-amylase family glycosyl hydrolase [Dyadobacter pollutisoli]WAC13560.1 alpha-amylase family glycosyl hydrolase [Dyadobacter pollutisoli]
MPTPITLLQPDRPDSMAGARELINRAIREGVSYYPSPISWRDEVLYFLLPDRFSDGKESTRPLLTRDEITALRHTPNRPDWNWQQWAESGTRWQGGTIEGIRSQLVYLKELGITAIWIGPIFKQRVGLNSYHGYGIQDFLDVDPRFGTREDLINLVSEAHSKGIRILLDVIVNHSGDNWGYVPPGAALSSAVNEPAYKSWPHFYGSGDQQDTKDWQLAWRDAAQTGFATEPIDITSRHEGAWPREFQSKNIYTRAGMGNLGESHDIGDPHAEHKRTDFLSLKDFALDVPGTLSQLIQCLQYWIALTDCDGFRIDTVKHMALEETRNFCGAIREFADLIGKHNFLLIGEIAGGDGFQDAVLDYTAMMERNLNAALDIGSARLTLSSVAKGLQRGNSYFDIFNEQSQGFESHRSFGDRHVSILDDHDHVFGSKVRFSAEVPDHFAVKDYYVTVPVAIQLLTLGIPCIYYGTEQAFAGPASTQTSLLDGWRSNDKYLRESMFGPAHPRANSTEDIEDQVMLQDETLPGFGPFGTSGKHCFDQSSPAYIRISSLCKTRAAHPVLRLGRQYLRQIQVPGTGFEFPKAGELVAWSRILYNQEALCIVNPNGADARGGNVVIAAELSAPGSEYVVIANTAQMAAGVAYAGSHPIGSKLTVKTNQPSGPSFVEIRDIQSAEVVVLLKNSFT